MLYISLCSCPNGLVSGSRITFIFKSSTLCRAVLRAWYASRIAASTSSASAWVEVSGIVEEDGKTRVRS